jgi:hypothetical protein
MEKNMAKSNFPSEHPTRKAWQGMMNRCYTPTNKDYPRIGGAGIKVCDRWHTYANFYEDMGDKPEGSIFSRYVPTMDFTPDNCYWQEKVNSRSNALYSIWKGIRRRCGLIGSSTDKHFRSYVRRGIGMDDDFANSFAAFAEEVGPRPSPRHQIDRIDNNLGYVRGNMRWATPKENANNTSGNIYIEIDGERKTLQQWCDHYGVNNKTVHGRFSKLFIDDTKKDYACVQINAYTGELIQEYPSIKQAAAATGLKYGTIAKCLCGGNATAGGYAWRYKS